ncbi:MAG: LytR C-terminal domain-containing protein [Acetivibrio sp.]
MKKKQKRTSPLQRFIQVFIKSLSIIVVLGIVGFISYKGTLAYYDKFGGPKSDKGTNIINELYGKVEVAEVSKNLIYAVGEDGKIKALVLEIFNTNTGNMDYMTIPMKAEFTISNELYQKLCTSGCGAPQIIKISRMNHYFTNETLYKYGVIMLEDLFDIDINYYTVVPAKQFKKMFKMGTAQPAYAPDGTTIESYYEWKIKKSYIKKIESLQKDENALKDYIKEQVKNCKSNLSLGSKLKYSKDYQKSNPRRIYTYSIYGVMLNTDFGVNVEETNHLLETILANTSYMSEQKSVKAKESVKASLGHSIRILNGSQITGLAASYESRLKEAGYTISSIGNYTGEMITQTKILVKNEELGKDLVPYFPNAIIEKAEYLTDCDIEILLGTDAKVETY